MGKDSTKRGTTVPEAAAVDKSTGTVAAAARARLCSSLHSPFIIGCGFLLISLLLAIFIPRPEPFQVSIFAVFVSVAASCVMHGVAGMLNIQTRWITAGGPVAIFILTLFLVLHVSVPDRSPLQWLFK
jgi:hypothetical protein